MARSANTARVHGNKKNLAVFADPLIIDAIKAAAAAQGISAARFLLNAALKDIGGDWPEPRDYRRRQDVGAMRPG